MRLSGTNPQKFPVSQHEGERRKLSMEKPFRERENFHFFFHKQS
jgi:hypothetical protein